MNLHSLKAAVQSILPILSSNLGAAYNEYMEGSLAHGAYNYVLSRHGTAVAVVSRDDLEAENAYRACASLAIDLRSGINTMQDKDAAKDLVESFWQCFRDAGFTEVHGLFQVPMLPGGTVRV